MVDSGYQLITDDVVAIRADENGQLLIERDLLVLNYGRML